MFKKFVYYKNYEIVFINDTKNIHDSNLKILEVVLNKSEIDTLLENKKYYRVVNSKIVKIELLNKETFEIKENKFYHYKDLILLGFISYEINENKLLVYEINNISKDEKDTEKLFLEFGKAMKKDNTLDVFINQNKELILSNDYYKSVFTLICKNYIPKLKNIGYKNFFLFDNLEMLSLYENLKTEIFQKKLSENKERINREYNEIFLKEINYPEKEILGFTEKVLQAEKFLSLSKEEKDKVIKNKIEFLILIHELKEINLESLENLCNKILYKNNSYQIFYANLTRARKIVYNILEKSNIEEMEKITLKDFI